MIQIDRSSTPTPQKLLDDAPAAKAAIAEIVAEPGRELRSRDFEGDVYASEPVKEALWRMQHAKCCFCEHEYERKWSTVEHFRPKTSVRRTKSGPRTLGYWWLAYEFENLYFCCSNCNNPKSDYFPLTFGTVALSESALPSAMTEQALIVDPGFDEPENHLTFARLPNGAYRIAPRNGSMRGRATIDAARLDRDDLDEVRDKHQATLDSVAELFEAAKGTEFEEKVTSMAQELCGATSRFALLARVFFRNAGVL